MIVVRLSDSVWQYNNNQTWISFEPRPSDRLIAAVDMDADTIMGLRDATGKVGGITQGYSQSDLTFQANVFGGETNAGEFTIRGTYIDVAVVVAPITYDLGAVNSGIAVHDDASGMGYVLYSIEPIHDRFADHPGHVDNSERLIAVAYQGGQWVYSDDEAWVAFIPRNTDRLIAKVNFSADTIESLQGQTGRVDGVQLGFTGGDLMFAADRFAGSINNGEFTVDGTSFDAVMLETPNQSVAMGATESTVGVQDDATGRGFLMFSPTSIVTRFGDTDGQSENPHHVIAVRYQNGTWQRNDDTQWIDFEPQAGDRLLASVDFDAETVTPLVGAAGSLHGIEQGYVGGDLVFFANGAGSQNDRGDFTIEGSYFELSLGAVDSTFLRTSKLDSNGDGKISALDVLRIINRLGTVSEPDEFQSPPPFDPNGDGRVSALDALIIINELSVLNSQVESEASPVPRGEAATILQSPLSPIAVDRAIQISEDDDSPEHIGRLF